MSHLAYSDKLAHYICSRGVDGVGSLIPTKNWKLWCFDWMLLIIMWIWRNTSVYRIHVVGGQGSVRIVLPFLPPYQHPETCSLYLGWSTLPRTSNPHPQCCVPSVVIVKFVHTSSPLPWWWLKHQSVSISISANEYILQKPVKVCLKEWSVFTVHIINQLLKFSVQLIF